MLHLQVQYSQQKCGLHGYWEHRTIHDLGKEKVHWESLCYTYMYCTAPPPLPSRPRTNGFEFDQK